jgi:CubicO group peptidase (beta-lactamase class C family)
LRTLPDLRWYALRMMNVLLCLVFAALAGQSALAGTWTAERVYGPVFLGGRIVVSQSNGWRASVGGMTRVAPSGSAPDFVFDDGSELRLQTAGSRLFGQWVQPGDAETTNALATAVSLVQVRRGVWRGIVHPVSNVQHLTLLVTPGSHGTLQASLLNPERNAGVFIGVRTLSLRGATIRLQRSGSDDVVGRWDQRMNTIFLQDPGLPGTFAFKRNPPTSTVSYRYHVPVAGDDGWPTARLQNVGFDEKTITGLVNELIGKPQSLRSPRIQALLIARHGRLVLDEYFDGFDAQRPHDVRSAGKSVTTLMVGKAIARGAAFTPQSTISSLLSRYAPFANYSMTKDRITVADLMSMSAGYACDDNDDASPGNEDRMQSQTTQPDWYLYTLDLPMLFTPGENARYCSAEINLLGAVIEDKTGTWLPFFFDENFARPMQFGAYAMWLMPPPTYTAYMAGGDAFRPRDFLKFGELFLDHGRWHGTQIVDPSWLSDVAQKHSYVGGGGGDYGWGWHLATYRVGGRSIAAINAGGNGGQLLYVFPSLDMTVMIAAGNYGDYRVWSKFQELPNAILAALSSETSRAARKD